MYAWLSGNEESPVLDHLLVYFDSTMTCHACRLERSEIPVLYSEATVVWVDNDLANPGLCYGIHV
jgi:hypothetical protein